MTHIPFKVSLLRLVFLLLPVTVAAQEARLSDYVDPRIGSEGLGRVFIGPSCPYLWYGETIARLHCPSQ